MAPDKHGGPAPSYLWEHTLDGTVDEDDSSDDEQARQTLY